MDYAAMLQPESEIRERRAFFGEILGEYSRS